MNCDENAMVPDQSLGDVLSNLRRSAASDPKRARSEFVAILQGQENFLSELLESASGPGDGRLRQMIATVYRINGRPSILEPWLLKWIQVESDEFTKSAIRSALAGLDARNEDPSSSTRSAPQLVEAYRYVSDRLCHRVRNALARPSVEIQRLEHLIGSLSDSDLRRELDEILAVLKSGLIRIARVVEFDTGDDYQAWASIPLIGWLEAAANQFASRYGQATHSVSCPPEVRRVKVRATRFLLETIFDNLWSNAIQNVDSPCHIALQCALDRDRRFIDMTVLDNGSGFPGTQRDTAFQQIFSTKSDSRGRGLLEVADAVHRLHGEVELTEVDEQKYRIRIRLPVEV